MKVKVRPFRSRQTLIRAFVILAALAVSIVPATANASETDAPTSKPQEVTTQTVKLLDVVEMKNYHDGYCLSVDYDQFIRRWVFLQRTCVAGTDFTLWYRYQSDTLGQAFRSVRRPDVCLADGDNVPGVGKYNLWVVYCNQTPGEGDHRIWWRVGPKIKSPAGDWYWQFKNYHSGWCLAEFDQAVVPNFADEEPCGSTASHQQFWHPF